MSARFADIARIFTAAQKSGGIKPKPSNGGGEASGFARPRLSARLDAVFHIGLLAMLVTLAAGTASALAAQPSAGPEAAARGVALTAVDAGAFTFLSQTSALVSGDGFEKQGLGLNKKVISNGQFDLLGPATKCADGYTGRLVGKFVEANAADSFSYTIDNQLCPTGEQNVYSATGTYNITAGTGKYAKVRGAGLFEGMADFGEAKYKCLLLGIISY
jgi:hypothetical protein